MPGFGVDLFGEDVFGPWGNLDVLPSGRVAWRFFDGVDTYLLPVNPQTASMPSMKRSITQKATTAGIQVLYEGLPDVKTMTFSGVIMNETQWDLLRLWVRKRKQIQITDDLGAANWVYITSFRPSRNKNNTYEWLMDYTAEATVVDRGAI